MKKIDRLLSTGKAFRVETIACMEHAELLKSYCRKTEEFPWSKETKEVQLAFKVAFISVCHQFNWDFMQNALAENLLNKGESLAAFLTKVTARDLEDWLRDYPKKERIRSKERAGLLRDVGQVIQNSFGGDLGALYKECEAATLGDGKFHSLLDKFEGYRSDPLRKKTNVLTHDLVKEKILSFRDEGNIEPAIDYHIMRLYLRTGRVIPMDEALFRFLEGAPNPRGALVRQLRLAVSEAEKLTAYYAGLSVADVNYIEWQVGRSICHNEKPLCQVPDAKIEIAEDVDALAHGKCPYTTVCLSFNSLPKFIEFEEPNYISKDY